MDDGKAKEIKGRLREAAGDLTGNEETRREGAAERREGAAQQAKDKLGDAVDKAKDALRR